MSEWRAPEPVQQPPVIIDRIGAVEYVCTGGCVRDGYRDRDCPRSERCTKRKRKR